MTTTLECEKRTKEALLDGGMVLKSELKYKQKPLGPLTAVELRVLRSRGHQSTHSDLRVSSQGFCTEASLSSFSLAHFTYFPRLFRTSKTVDVTFSLSVVGFLEGLRKITDLCVYRASVLLAVSRFSQKLFPNVL